MNIEDIQKEWAQDAQMDQYDLANESLKTPILHSKYYQMYHAERLNYEKLKGMYDHFHHVLTEFYLKRLPEEDIEYYELGEMPDKRISKGEVEPHIKSNKAMRNLIRRMVESKERVDFLKSILDQINQRSFVINNAIKFKMFEAGAN